MPEPTREERLVSDRDRLEAAMDEAGPRELPALVREHRMVLAELASLAKPQKGSTRDQLAEKRAAREAGASGSAASEVRQ
jgi:hypothetical protein